MQTPNQSLNSIEFSEVLEITRGVRQGCPLSALLFNLVMEPLRENTKLKENFE